VWGFFLRRFAFLHLDTPTVTARFIRAPFWAVIAVDMCSAPLQRLALAAKIERGASGRIRSGRRHLPFANLSSFLYLHLIGKKC